MTRRGLWWGAVVIAVVAAVAPVPAAAIERWYSGGIYPRLQHAVTPLSNLLPFALFDVLWVVAVAAVAVVAVRHVRRDGWRRGSGRLLLALCGGAAVVYLVFLGTWGLNYRRVSVIDRVAFDASQVNRDALHALGDRAAAELNRLYPAAHAAGEPLDRLAAAVGETQRALGASWQIVPARPKATLLGAYFHHASIAGMTDPFFLETLLAPDLLDVERPFVIAHEWAHLAGYADESEASFVAWLACRQGGPAAQYSAWLMVIGYAPPHRPLRDVLDLGPRGDLLAIRQRYERTSPMLRYAAQQGYDAYLKANRVRAGVISYDLVVQLILGTPLDDRGRPRLR
jgi:hypothetical protein